MENKEFDIFSLIVVVLENKLKIGVLSILFFFIFFIVGYLQPIKNSLNLVVDSSVLEKEEILFKFDQIQSLIDEKQYKTLSNIIEATPEELATISSFSSKVYKKSDKLVEVNVQSSNHFFLETLPNKLYKYFNEDSLNLKKLNLKIHQLELSLNKLNTELDSTNSITSNNKIVIQDITRLIDKRNEFEENLNFLNILQIYEGAPIIVSQKRMLVLTVSSAMIAFIISIVLFLSFYFFKNIKEIK